MVCIGVQVLLSGACLYSCRAVHLVLAVCILGFALCRQQCPQTTDKIANKLLPETGYTSAWPLVCGKLLQVVAVQRSDIGAVCPVGIM